MLSFEIKVALLSVIVGTVFTTKCPDGQSCPSNFTCCQEVNRQYGCCPYEKAMCCDDNIHCCPPGLTCNVKNQSCDGKSRIPFRWMVAIYPQSHLSDFLTNDVLEEDEDLNLMEYTRRVDDVKCQDGRKCPPDFTCCTTPRGFYGCCPFKNAMCCTDQTHCCPQGFTCNTTLGTCDKGETIDFSPSSKSPAKIHFPDENNMKETCPDHKGTCDESQTCCKLISGLYGCCPYQQATCCLDGVHCCPHGYKCDAAESRCIASGKSWLFLDSTKYGVMQSSRPLPKKATNGKKNGKSESSTDVEKVVCSDSSYCNGEGSCCKNVIDGATNFGCCESGATCCDDGRCCPADYDCHMGTCLRRKSFGWLFMDDHPLFINPVEATMSKQN